VDRRSLLKSNRVSRRAKATPSSNGAGSVPAIGLALKSQERRWVAGAVLLAGSLQATQAQTPASDLSTSGIAVFPAALIVGSNVTHTITVSTGRPNQATGVVVTDMLPASVVSRSASAPDGLCTENCGTVTWLVGVAAEIGASGIARDRAICSDGAA
jgi:uncharacterized repeat protein (TIGR01451 family)